MKNWLCTILILSLAACGPSKPPAAPMMVVNAVRVALHTTPSSLDLVGVIQPYQQSDLRSRVTGLVTKRSFQGGQAVTVGQILYTIDDTQYRESLATARADLAQALAALAQAQGDLQRYTILAKQNAIAQQTYQQSMTVVAQNKAVVDSRLAALRIAQQNLSYATITSPVTGQIDTPAVDVGSLVTADQTLLGTVSSLDPVYVAFSIPEGAAIGYAMQHNMTEVQATPLNMPPVTLVLPNGQTYPIKGRMEFASRTIGTTGTLSMRAVFDNPSQLLRPGLNVRVQLLVGEVSNAILIPQRGIGDLLGRKYVYVLGPRNIVEQRMIELGPVVGELQVVTKGLKHGDVVIADGLQFVKVGQPAQAKIIPLRAAAGEQ